MRHGVLVLIAFALLFACQRPRGGADGDRNAALLQIWSGPVRRIVTVGDWLNVLDPSMNLHVREYQIDGVWIVRKPTSTGIVTALEVYARGELVVLLVGTRPHGEAENEAWRRIVTSAPEDPA
jgi:putative hemin transport protein